MKKSIIKTISGLIMTAGIALVITSCQKEQNAKTPVEVQVKVNPNGASDQDVVSSCGAIPDTLKVPEGNKFFLQAFARGFQIYEVQRSATNPNVFSWVNIAPLATLYLKPDFTNQVINHFAGPTWEFLKGVNNGEKVVGKKLVGITQDASAIQWLLLKAVDPLSTPGNKVTFIQRLCTHGGLAPTSPADEAHLGNKDSIPYTASYLFYIAKD
jgi:hypothetical protein